MAPQKIKQWVTGQDGLDKLRMEEAERLTPGQDEVLVEVHSVSLNYRDTEGTNELTAMNPL
jgi:NADPH:quinone reductase-like Zn-dependent oxidoreductase